MNSWPRPMCCKPWLDFGASGSAWFHAYRCKISPGKKIENTERRTHPSRRLRPDQAHPPCIAAYADGGSVCGRCAPLLHPAGCECGQCGYANAHADEGTG